MIAERKWFSTEEADQLEVSQWFAGEMLLALRASLDFVDMELQDGSLRRFDSSDDLSFAEAVTLSGACEVGTGVGDDGIVWDCNKCGASFSVALTKSEWSAVSAAGKDLLRPLRH